MVTKAIHKENALCGDALEFATEHCLVEYVELAIAATREVFADALRIDVSLRRDPEFGSSYIEVNAVIDDEPEQEALKYSKCGARWARVVPPEVGEKLHLTTS